MSPKTSGSPSSRPKSSRILPVFLLLAGTVCLAVVSAPAAVFYLRRIIHPRRQLINPVATSPYPALIIAGSGSYPADYGVPANWFVNSISLPDPVITPREYFFLSIPSVGLTDAPVRINGSDLFAGAIHYPGTPLPGDFGNVVIFGHSALPRLYPSGSPQIVFNPLLDVKTGEVILARSGGLDYSYRITGITEVAPDKIEVLAQDYSRRQITLITCVPLGTYWHRLVVRGELVK